MIIYLAVEPVKLVFMKRHLFLITMCAFAFGCSSFPDDEPIHGRDEMAESSDMVTAPSINGWTCTSCNGELVNYFIEYGAYNFMKLITLNGLTVSSGFAAPSDPHISVCYCGTSTYALSGTIIIFTIDGHFHSHWFSPLSSICGESEIIWFQAEPGHTYKISLSSSPMPAPTSALI